MGKMLIVSVAYCNLALTSSKAFAEKRATPEDLSATCSIDEVHRTISVELFNKGTEKVFLQRRSILLDYQESILPSSSTAILKGASEVKLVGKATANASPTKLKATGGSSEIMYIEPLGTLHESFNLDQQLMVPKEGGDFIIRIGRVIHEEGKKDKLIRCPELRAHLIPRLLTDP